MNSKKIGLVLSHIFVRESENYKFDWVESALDEYKKLDIDFFTVLCGHGLRPPTKLSDKFDNIFWQENIMENQLGTGHPYFSLKGFELCKKASCKMTLKNRAYDYITSKDFFNKRLVIREQTSKTKNYWRLILIRRDRLFVRLVEQKSLGLFCKWSY